VTGPFPMDGYLKGDERHGRNFITRILAYGAGKNNLTVGTLGRFSAQHSLGKKFSASRTFDCYHIFTPIILKRFVLLGHYMS